MNECPKRSHDDDAPSNKRAPQRDDRGTLVDGPDGSALPLLCVMLETNFYVLCWAFFIFFKLEYLPMPLKVAAFSDRTRIFSKISLKP
jgi:hypothetical protein